MQRRTWFIVAGLVIATVLAWECIPIQVTVWDGGYELTVHVSSPEGAMRSIKCQACGNMEEVQTVLGHLAPTERGQWSAMANPFTGQSLKLHVPLSGRNSPWGRNLNTRQPYKHLVVIGQLPDGRSVAKLVEIPDSGVAQEVSVSLP